MRKPLTLVASDAVVRVLDGDVEVAPHVRSWERGRQIETEAHLDGLAYAKRHAREHRGKKPPVLPDDPRVRDRVAAPRSLSVYDALAQRGEGGTDE